MVFRATGVLDGCAARSDQRSETISGFFAKFQLLDCLESFVQILDDIVDVFRSDGKTNRVRFDTLIQKLFFCALAVGGGCRMDNQ